MGTNLTEHAVLPDLTGPVHVVAPALLGTVLTHGGVSVRLTEVEAYAGTADPASHAARGRTPRNEVMFGPPGRLYVYFVYGMHWCANVVTGVEGSASAVLLRAGAVVGGLELARTRRPAAALDRDLARGPARLAQALALTGTQNGDRAELTAGPAPGSISSGPRVGVAAAGEVPWRFWITGDTTVSAYRRGGARRRTPGAR